MQCELSAEARNELAAMAYARWSDAFEALKQCKARPLSEAGKGSPKDTWQDYWNAQLASAQKEYDLASRLKAEICKYSPLVCGE